MDICPGGGSGSLRRQDAHDDSGAVRAFLDQRSDLTAARLETTRGTLDGGIRQQYRRTSDVVRSVEAQTSNENMLLQCADVPMGAVGYHCNELHRDRGAVTGRCRSKGPPRQRLRSNAAVLRDTRRHPWRSDRRPPAPHRASSQRSHRRPLSDAHPMNPGVRRRPARTVLGSTGGQQKGNTMGYGRSV